MKPFTLLTPTLLALVLATPALAGTWNPPIPEVNPATTTCAGYYHKLQSTSFGDMALAVSVAPAEDTGLLISDQYTMPVPIRMDPQHLHTINKYNLPVWLVLRFARIPRALDAINAQEPLPTLKGLMISVMYAKRRGGCVTFNEKMFDFDKLPDDLVRRLVLLKYAEKLLGSDNVDSLSDDIPYRVSNMFKASLQVELNDYMLQSIEGN